MPNKMFLWTALLYLWICVMPCTGLDISPCINGYLDVHELTSVSLTCEQTTNSVWWKMYQGSTQVGTVATCNTTMCVSPSSVTDIQASRPNSATSVLYIDLQTHRDHNVKLQCFSRHRLTCSVRSVYYSQPTNCRFDVNAEVMRVSGSCDVPKIYASDDQYICQWIRDSKNVSTTLNGTFSLTSFTDQNTSLSYKTGTCSFMSSLFLVEGVFNFSITTTPGSGKKYIVTVTVDKQSNVTVLGPEGVNTTVSQGKGDLKTALCTGNRMINVEAGELISLVCKGTPRSTTWSVISGRRITVASCNSTHCTMQRDFYSQRHVSHMMALRPNSTVSELYVDTGAYRSSVTTFSCRKQYRYGYSYDSCRIRSVYSALPTNCQFDFLTENSTVTGGCDIPKMYDSNNRYQCQWIEQYQEQMERTITGNLITSSFIDNGWPYKKGTCSFVSPLFELDGMFTYRIDVTPGHQEYIATVDVAVSGNTSSLTISGRGHLDTRITTNVTEIQLFRCFGGTTYNVKFGARVGLICSNTRGTLRWNMYYRYRNVQVAYCNSTQCTMQAGTRSQHMMASRPNGTSSVLYVSMAPYQDYKVKFYCSSRYSPTCFVRTVYVSPPTNCSIVIDAANLTLSGRCDFKEMYTSDGSYSCSFVLQDENKIEVLNKGILSRSSFYDHSIGKKFYNGTCSFSSTFFLIPGTLNFSVEVKPGFRTHLALVDIDENSNMSISATDDVNITFHGAAPELRYLRCANSQSYDVSSHSQVALVCVPTHYRAPYNTFYWKYNTHNSRYYYSRIATCTSTKCTNERNWAMAIRPNSTVTIAYINMQKYTSSILNVQCSMRYWSTNCKLRFIYSALPSNCQITVNADNMTVSGSCDIAKIQASNGVYNCRWIQSFENQTEYTVYGNFYRQKLYYSSQGTAYNGTCSFNVPLYAIANSTISYSVDFDPGDRYLVATVLIDEDLKNITVAKSEGVNVTVIPGELEGQLLYHGELEAPMAIVCGSSQALVNVPEEGLVKLICPHTRQSLKWQYKYKYSYYNNAVAMCNATSCSPIKGSRRGLVATRPSSSLSFLYVEMKQWRYNEIIFVCTWTDRRTQNQYCSLRPVYPASLVNCSLEVNADAMTVSGSCEVERVFSGDRTVNCTWIEHFQNQTIKYINGSLDLDYTYDHVAGKNYRNGSCSFAAPLLFVNGVFHYSIHVNPGSPMYIATLYIDGAFNMTLIGAEDVETAVSGFPTEMNMFECRDGKTVNVPEYSQAGLICKDTEESDSNHMEWVVYPGAHKSGESNARASCNVSSCVVWASSEDMLAVRPNASMGILYLSLLDKRDYHQRVECSTSSLKFCIIRSVYASPPTNCQFDFNTTTYSVQGSCEVKKMYSSDGQYTCEWIQQVQHQTTTIPATRFALKPFRDPINRLSYRSGVCYVSLQLMMTKAATFIFSIKISPGTLMYVATLELGAHTHEHVKLTGGDHVNATMDGIPLEKPTATTTRSTTPEIREASSTTEQPYSTSPKATTPPSEGDHSKVVGYIAGGVGGSIGVILIIAVVVISVLVLRKLQARGEEMGRGFDNEGYFYTSRLKSGSISDITSNLSVSASIDSGHNSSIL